MADEKMPERDDYRNQASYESALRKYRARRRARYVWRQISLEERVWILEQAGHRDPGGAAGSQELPKLSGKQLREVLRYPRSEHRREIYQARLKASPRSKDIRVRKHERRLRERGV